MSKVMRGMALLMAVCLLIGMVPAVAASEPSFPDVKEGAYYYEAVKWAVTNGITAGGKDGKFNPGGGCTRGQVALFLYRAAGKPALTSTDSPFPDVKAGGTYGDAVLWAYQNGIASGKKDGTFGLSDTCTRAQIALFLYRYMGKPALQSTDSPFTDMQAGGTYGNAVLWAYQNGITTGKTATTFVPNDTCTRAQIVTFLYRASQKVQPPAQDPLRVTTQPKGKELSSGEFADLSVAVLGGKAPYTYQWLRNGIAISGANYQIYTAQTEGSYACMITDAAGNAVLSQAAAITVKAPEHNGLWISQQPVGGQLVSGSAIGLTVVAQGGKAPYVYQWYLNGGPITGANLPSHVATQAGTYFCSVMDQSGSLVLSTSAVVSAQAEQYGIVYELYDGDPYLQNADITNPNPKSFTSGQDTIVLMDLAAPDGYEFLGWYDAPKSVGGNRVTEISKGSSGEKTLYAHWKERVYNVTYRLYQTPLGAIKEEKYLHYTVSKGLIDLPNPEINNYVFLGWYTDDGTAMESIPAGTTGDITLNAYWTSKRNLTKAVDSLGDPIILENSEDGTIYFVYEIGTIENVPLSDAIWTIQSVSGLTQQEAKTVTTEISEEQAEEIAKTISSTTVDSATWSLSEEWNDVTEVSEEWAEENGMTQEEANEKTKTESGTISITDSNGGCKTTTTTDGTTTVDYDSKNYTHGNSAEFHAKISGKYTSEVGVNASLGEGIGLNAGKKYEIGGEIGGKYEQHQETNEHTGTDKTKVHTEVETGSTSWNKASTTAQTKAASESVSVKQALSSIISNTKGYGKSYSAGGENSKSQGFSSTDSQSANTSSTLTYFKSKTETTTTTYSTDGKSEGCYRLVVAGTIHVFAVVGYDIATQSYFTYTYNVLDDKTYEFLDYSPDLNFDDYENGALPFEVPYFVHEYVTAKTACTEGLSFKTNSSDGTAMVVGYNNEAETDVVIPSYISSGTTAYKVTGISAGAFAGKPIEAIVLGDHIKEIPAGAFKNCTSLKEIAGFFTVIGDEAFSGCTNLESYTVSSAITKIGASAFKGVSKIKVNAVNAQTALEVAKATFPKATEQELLEHAWAVTQDLVNSAIASGAGKIILDLSAIVENCELSLSVPEMSYFELQGGNRSFTNLKLTSDADETVLKELKIVNSESIPLDISSEKLTMEVVNVKSQSYALLLSADGPIITLRRDNSLASENGIAVVSKDPVLESVSVNRVDGYLDITGDMYVCGDGDLIGELRRLDYLAISNGKIVQISEESFAQYIKGVFSLNFDANGGTVAEPSKSVLYGQAYGELPAPSRELYSFIGWFTQADGGTQVTASDIMTATCNITVYAHWKRDTYDVYFDTVGGSCEELSRVVNCGDRIGTLPVPYMQYHYFAGWYTAGENGYPVDSDYINTGTEALYLCARWEKKPLSGWVPVESVPEGAQIVNEKWTYTWTDEIETTEATLEGYDRIGNYWRQVASGAVNYSTLFPDGFDKNHWIYTSFAKAPVDAYETETSKREVSNSWAGFVYWHWMYSVTYSNSTTRMISPYYGSWDENGNSGGFMFKHFYALTSAVDCRYLDKYYCCSHYMPSYYCHDILPGDKTNIGTPRFFRFNYYVSNYVDYEMVFQYRRVEQRESNVPVTNGGNNSNVQKWVQYREA